MKLTQSQREFLIREQIIGAAVFNVLLNALLAWLSFRAVPEVSVWGDWKIVAQRTMLMPVHAHTVRAKDGHANFDFANWPHWNPKVKWQPRPVYVLEAKPKIPDYPYSRMLIVVDAETFLIPYKEAFDKKGELWKILINASNASPDMATKPPEAGVAVAIDLQANHATAVNFRKNDTNTNLDLGLFSLASLRKRAT